MKNEFVFKISEKRATNKIVWATQFSTMGGSVGDPWIRAYPPTPKYNPYWLGINMFSLLLSGLSQWLSVDVTFANLSWLSVMMDEFYRETRGYGHVVSSTCSRTWFHYSCIGMGNVPDAQEDVFCSDECRKSGNYMLSTLVLILYIDVVLSLSIYCYCHKPKGGETMVQCVREDACYRHEWYHPCA